MNKYWFNNIIRKVYRILGLDIKIRSLNASSNKYVQLVKILNHLGVDLFVDIGAHNGTLSKSLIDYGYKDAIQTYEPYKKLSDHIKKISKKYHLWQHNKLAISNSVKGTELFVTKNSLFNSLHIPKYKRVTREFIHTITINHIDIKPYQKVFIKVDTQGHEKDIFSVISDDTLKNVVGIMIEANLTPYYFADQWKLTDLIKFFEDKGFTCKSISSVGIDNDTGFNYDIDLIFVKDVG